MTKEQRKAEKEITRQTYGVGSRFTMHYMATGAQYGTCEIKRVTESSVFWKGGQRQSWNTLATSIRLGTKKPVSRKD